MRSDYATGAILAHGLITSITIEGNARDLSGLLKNNPLGAVAGASTSEKAPAPPAPQMELRAVVREQGGYLFNVYDPATKKSAWIKEGDKGSALLLRSYDQKKETVLLVEAEGRTVSLTLKSAKSAGPSVRSSTAFVATVARELQVQAHALSAVAAPPSEISRMEQVAQEVTLRREQRQQIAATLAASKT